MPATPSDALVAGAQAAVVAGFFLALGRLVSGVALRGRGTDGVTRWGLAFVGFAFYTLVLMLAHIVTGGRVLASAALTRSITLAVFGALALAAALRYRDRGPRTSPGGKRATLLAGGLVLAALLVWGTPVARLLPLDVAGDSNLHAGWSSQITNGEPTPSAAITGDIPNFYPWLTHGMLSLLARFTPGGRAFHALAPLQLLQVAGSVLALFVLGRAVGRQLATGAATVLLGALTGGLGFVMLRGLDVVVDPRAEGTLYLGDLLYKRSYNVAFYDLSPAFPRDVSWALLAGALALLVVGLRSRASPTLVAAGVALGLVGLAGAESFFVGIGVAVAAALFPVSLSRRRTAACLLLPAAAIYAVWLVPQVASYLGLGGYVNLTVVGPVTLPASAVLVSWGIGVPLAVLGLAQWLPRARHDPAARVVLAVAVMGGGALLASVVVPAVGGRAFLSLGRAHRYWPLLHFGIALYAALGAVRLVEWAAARGRRRALAAWSALALLAVPSPVVASLALPLEFGQPGLVREAAQGEPGALLNLVAPAPSGRCRAAVPLSIDTQTWAYTGYRLVAYSWATVREGNSARIRWRDIYDHITPEARRRRDNRILTRGRGGPARWRSVARRYRLDVVVAPSQYASRPAFAGLERREADDRPFTVFRLTDCGT